MRRSLVLKELREVRGIAAAALALYLFVLINLIGVPLLGLLDSGEAPFVGPSFAYLFGAVSVVLAVALGFRQSAWEERQGTYLFLLPRPLSRDWIFAAKLAAGLSVMMALMGVAIVVYAGWASMPGHHASPFVWSMTSSVWRLCLVLPLVYLGAFLSGLRPARWFGTRLLPLAAAGFFVWLVLFIPWSAPRWSAAACVYLLLLANILYVARTRDYA